MANMMGMSANTDLVVWTSLIEVLAVSIGLQSLNPASSARSRNLCFNISKKRLERVIQSRPSSIVNTPNGLPRRPNVDLHVQLLRCVHSKLLERKQSLDSLFLVPIKFNTERCDCIRGFDRLEVEFNHDPVRRSCTAKSPHELVISAFTICSVSSCSVGKNQGCADEGVECETVGS